MRLRESHGVKFLCKFNFSWGIHHFEDAGAWTSKSAFSVFYQSKLNWKVLMKCTLQDMMNSYRSAFLLRLNIALTRAQLLRTKRQFQRHWPCFLLFFSALQLILDLFLHNTDWILMNASLCLVMITFPLKFPLILIIQMPFCRCLDPKLHLFVPLSTP